MQLVVNVVVLASMYALLALGYVLVYRASRVLNLAHGGVMMLAAYVLYGLASALPAGPGPAPLIMVLTIALIAGVGALLYHVCIRPMAGRPIFSTILLTVAIGIALDGLVVMLWTPRVLYPAALLGITDQPIALPFGAVISTLGAATVLLAVAAVGGTAAFLHLTRRGTLMLAVAENPVLAARRGINPDRLFQLAWGLAAASAAVAGILYALSNRLDASIALVGLKAFPTALVGGLGSLTGILPAALLVAFVEVVAIQLVSPQLADVAPFLVLLGALLVRPWGLAGAPEHIERA